MVTESEIDHFIEKMRSTKAPEKLPKLMRDTPYQALCFSNGQEVDAAFQEGLLRHLTHGARGIERDILARTLDARRAGDLAMAMLAAWESKDFNGRHDWVLDIVGMLGDDRAALEMEALITTWQYQGNTLRKRAISAMKVFLLMDSPTALMALVGLTHRQDVPSVYDSAVQELGRVAAARRVGWHELSDSVIPDCGLDGRGTRTFDLGERTLSLVLDAEFEPTLRDEAREVYDSIPEPGEQDDPQKVADARATWSLMHAKLQDVIRIQTRRMEEAMVTGRKWSVAAWREVILTHPLMTNFARRLVWGCFDEEGVLLGTFRASTDDATLIDMEDEEVELVEGMQVGLLHPLELTRAQRQQWADSFADYEVFAPFDQLGRPIFEVPDWLDSSKEFEPDQTKTYTSRALREVMKQEGWRRHTDGGYVRKFFFKYFEGRGHTMFLELDPGLTAGGESWDPEQHITSVTGKKKGASRDTPVSISKIPEVCFSEALRFIAQVEEYRA